MPDLELHCDLETRSAVDLRKTGVHVYAEDPTTDVWCMAYAFDGEDPDLWLPGQPVPEAVYDHHARGGHFVAHNAAFEIAIWRSILVPRYGFPETSADRWRCTMAQAYAMALPGALADAAGALGLSQTKDMAGHRLMMSMAKPRKVIGKLPAGGLIDDSGEWQTFTGADGAPLKIQWWVDGDRKEKLYAYCAQDVRTEMALDERLLRLRPQEQKLWVLDQKINDRGIVVDEKACLAAIDIVDRARQDLTLKIREASNFQVTSTTAVSQLVDFLAQNGVEVDSLSADKVTEMLTWDLPKNVRAVLECRQKGAKMSVAKIQALLNGMCKDGRAKGLTQYHAAGTGRWGGRRFQPQNLKRPDIKQDEIEYLIGLLHRWDAKMSDTRFEVFSAMVDDPIDALGNCIRALIKAPEGQVMGAADFANIEGRVLAWLAGEAWKVEAFKAYDAGTGPDLYKLAFSRSFGVPIDSISGDQRQIGKVQELALGYQGGPGAFETMAQGYGVDISQRYDEIIASAEQVLVEEVRGAWEAYGKKSKMAQRSWLPAEIIKRGWRNGHPATVQLWSDIETAAIRAVEEPGKVFVLRGLRFRVSGSFLWMQLPSGRCLCYPYPRVEPTETTWGATKHQLTFFGIDTYTRKWGRTSTYGGKLTENAVQAIARDLLAEALLRLDDEGIETVLHVHDEVVFYDDIDVGNCERVCSLMSTIPDWARGLPVATEGWIGERYRK